MDISLSGVKLLEPEVFHDARGWFLESYNQRQFFNLTGVRCEFVQDNHTRSARHALRGLHYQVKQIQSKLVRAVAGEALHVVVDLRKCSDTFGQWEGVILSAENRRMLWIPGGFAHGFVVMSEFSEHLYKVTEYRAPEYERAILWSDPVLAIDWQLGGAAPILSARDQAASLWRDAEVFE